MISEKIFYLLDKNKMTQKEFSRQTGISQSTISDWKRKKTNPSADRILRICEVLKVTPYELLAESGRNKGKKHPLMTVNKEEEILLESFRNLKSGQKERLMGYLAALENSK